MKTLLAMLMLSACTTTEPAIEQAPIAQTETNGSWFDGRAHTAGWYTDTCATFEACQNVLGEYKLPPPAHPDTQLSKLVAASIRSL